MKNRKGFTLVELLAVIVILGLMMGIAIPNIMGIIKKQKQSTYLEDGKKMISRAEYMLRSTTKVEKPRSGKCVVMTLGYLDNGEFNSPPYGGAYFSTLSYVIIKNDGGRYKYWVQLYECQTPQKESSSAGTGGYVEAVSAKCNNSTGTGLSLISSTDPNLNKPSTVGNGSVSFSYSNGVTTGCAAGDTKVYSTVAANPSIVSSPSSWNSKRDVLFDYND